MADLGGVTSAPGTTHRSGDGTAGSASRPERRLGSGFVTVGPHSEVKGRNAHPGRLIWNIETGDVAGDFARMKAAGAIVVTEPYGYEAQDGTAIATFADPDDDYFQLMSPMGM